MNKRIPFPRSTRDRRSTNSINTLYRMMNSNSQYYVYIMSNSYNTVLYIGFTNDLMRRVWEHQNHLVEGFTKRYNCNKLIYYELYADINDARKREKQLKEWNRSWKDELIDRMNPERVDLSANWDKDGYV